MPNHGSEIAIGGVKVSNKLLLIHQVTPTPENTAIPYISKVLAAGEVNIRIMILVEDGLETRLTCGVDNDGADVAQDAVKMLTRSGARILMVPDVGLISVFPHRERVAVISKGLKALSKSAIRVYASAVSLSAVTFAVDYNKMFEAVARIQEAFDIPHEHEPIWPQSLNDAGLDQTWKTNARYQEEVIKTYGFIEKKGLTFICIFFSEENMAAVTGVLAEFLTEVKLPYSSMQFMENHTRSFCFAVDGFEGTGEEKENLINKILKIETVARVIKQKADALIFHGPHFGDRYGIADKALGTLKTEGIQTLGAVFSEASVYLMFEEGKTSNAVKALKNFFKKP